MRKTMKQDSKFCRQAEPRGWEKRAIMLSYPRVQTTFLSQWRLINLGKNVNIKDQDKQTVAEKKPPGKESSGNKDIAQKHGREKPWMLESLSWSLDMTVPSRWAPGKWPPTLLGLSSNNLWCWTSRSTVLRWILQWVVSKWSKKH